MPFLEKLRMNNIFPRNPASDRPFGMPEIDDGEFGPMMHQAQGYARTANNEADQRQKEMMKFEFDLKNSSRPQPGGIAGSRLTQMMTRPGSSAPAVQGGFSPMQKQFREDDIRNKARQQEQSDMSTKFQQAMQMQQMKGGQDIDLENVRTAGDTAQIGQRGEIDQRAAALLAENQERVAGTKTAADIAAAKALQTGQMQRTVLEGQQNRLTNAQKPPTGVGADPAKQIAGRVQSLAIDAPALATLIDTQPDGQFRINPKASPQQIQAIRQYMMGQQPSAPAGKAPLKKAPIAAKPPDKTNQVSRR